MTVHRSVRGGKNLRRSIELLSELVGFETISADSNLELIAHVEGLLAKLGHQAIRVASEDGKKANLYATIGPLDKPGIMLSGHTDVVPVEGQNWRSDPFKLTPVDDRLAGRGAVDMKGFIACCLALIERLDADRLHTPIHLALSYDEEVGCLGIRRLITMLGDQPIRPRFCLVGEPTGMQIVTAHKGKFSYRLDCSGQAFHSSLAPLAKNAIHTAVDFCQFLRELQTEIEAGWARDGDYDVPYTTVHMGVIQGGAALNIVPDHCSLLFEFRFLPEDPIDELKARIFNKAEDLAKVSGMPVVCTELSGYSGLATPPDSELVAFMKSVSGGNSLGKISFGTEAGLISHDLGVPAVVCGPGSIARAHKADEYITVDEMAACDAMLDRLAARLID